MQKRITQKLPKNPQKQQQKPLPVKKKKVVYVKDVDSIAAKEPFVRMFATKLHDAMTTFGNSSLYKSIFEDLEKMRDGKFPESLKGKSKEQIYAAQLQNIQSKIEKYLEHKAKDGVKENVIAKLEAVEELSTRISKALNNLEFEPFTINGGQISKDTINPKTYKERYDAFVAQNPDNKDIELLPLPHTSNKNIFAYECMCKIMLKTVQLNPRPKDLAKRMASFDHLCKNILNKSSKQTEHKAKDAANDQEYGTRLSK